MHGLSRSSLSDIFFASNAFLDEFYKNLSFKIKMGRWAGVGHWVPSEVYLLVNLFEKLIHNAVRRFSYYMMSHLVFRWTTLSTNRFCYWVPIYLYIKVELISTFYLPEYAKLKPELFSKYIPNVLPPTCVANLDQYVEETKKMQEEIHSLPGFQQ